MMHYHPEPVDLSDAGDGKSKKFASQMLNEKVAWVPRHWMKVSEDTGIGNPKKATAEKGKRYAEAVTAKYAQLFKELTEEIY
jgi:creatinine amidohydrolase